MAFDAEDLAVFSAHFQDARLNVADFAYLPREKRFAFAADRFDWEGAALGEGNRRRRAAVHFEGVTNVRSRGVDLSRRDDKLDLLAITFLPAEAPGGAVELHFSGEVCIQLDVECVEAAMKDLGPAWECDGCPQHPLNDGDA
jgi:hypothetical protein